MGGIKKLVEYFVNYPVLANILIALTLLAGITAIFNTNKSFFPTRADRNIIITVAYPGASPEEMEEGLTLKIEEAINSISGIDEIFSTSSENATRITVATLENFDLDEIYTEVKNAVDAINSFPVGAEKPIVYKQKRRSSAQFLFLSGDVDLNTLKSFAQTIEDEMLADGVVSKLVIYGFPSREISIEVSEENLLRYHLTFDQVASAVRLNNRDISAGSLKSKTEEILIRSNAKTTEASEIANIVVRSNSDGSNLLIKDIATVKEQFAKVPSKVMIHDKQAVVIEISRLENEDLKAISDYVNEYVDKFNEEHDQVKLTVSFDFMKMLNQRLELLTSNGALGLVLVLISLGLFLSIRLSFWVAWGIPSSLLGMFILGSFVGLTINMISLFGMILVVGILVDDGIVIAENIYTHFEKHGNPVKAAVQGTIEVFPSVCTSVVTTIVAFTPLLLLTGGFEFLKDMAYVVCFSLGFSLLEAFFILPTHLAGRNVLSIKKEDTRSYRIRKALNAAIGFLKTSVYGKMLRFTMRHRFVSMAMLMGFLIIIGGLLAGGLIKATFFPQIPFNKFSIDIAFKPGEREENTYQYLKRFDKAVLAVNEDLQKEFNTKEDIIDKTYLMVGNSKWESGSHTGKLDIFYQELDAYGLNQFDLINKVRQKVGTVPEAEKFSVGANNRWGKPVSIRLMGKNYKALNEAKVLLKKSLSAIPDLKEIEDDVPVGRREMQFVLKAEAYFLGLNHTDITRQMRQGFFGEEVQRFMKGNDELKVWVRYPEAGRENISQLESARIKDVSGKKYPLIQLADYSITRGVSGIKHYETSRAVTVEANLKDPFGEVPPILNKIKQDIVPKIKAAFPSITIDYGGQSKESSKAAKQIALYFGGAFVLIFFILMTTFRSFYQALLIVLMIPIGWFGAILGHGVEDWISSAKDFPVSLLSVWGMVALSGIIVNDAVVFLAKFNRLLKDGKLSVQQAAYDAGLARFRPIILTSLTTVAGLYPLIKETSFQAQFLIPMAISVAYGVLVGTFIILLFFPVLILIFNDIRRYATWLWTGKKPTREEVEKVYIEQKRIAEYGKSI